jgi:hypothetical protein
LNPVSGPFYYFFMAISVETIVRPAMSVTIYALKVLVAQAQP